MTGPEVRRLIIKADGKSLGNPGPSAIGVMVFNESGIVVKEISQGIGKGTNNQAEYKALIASLETAARLGAEHIDIRLDSELVVRQISGEYRVRSSQLKPLFEHVRQLLREFKSFNIKHIPRGQNKMAHALANKALHKLSVWPGEGGDF